MDGKDSWEGSATELMVLIDPHAPPEGRDYRVFGMPLNPARLSVEIMERRVKDALDESGVFVGRGYKEHGRVLRLTRR